MAKRPKVPKTVETAVLTKSRRRCCLCFHLDADDSEKQGQIAHLDHDPATNIEDNLAWLCLAHHDRYDSKTTQSKRLTIQEVKHARDMLYQGSTTKDDSLRIFLCHATEDKPAVRELYRRLKADGFDPWLDEEDLLPGQEWELEIRRAVREADAVLVCVSKSAVTRRGFLQKEIRVALDVAYEQPEGSIFVIPVRLDDCEIPERLRIWQHLNLYEPHGYERLRRGLQTKRATVDSTPSAATVSGYSGAPSPGGLP